MSQHSSRGTAWEETRLRILNRDGWVCMFCGKELEGSDATVDHSIPKSAGGEDADYNLAASCRSCNGRKADKAQTRMPYYDHEWLDRV